MSGSGLRPARLLAVVLVLVVDVGFVLWGAMAALAPDHLLGPGGAPILPAGYEGFTGGSWQAMAHASPATAGYLELLFRTYGAYNVGFGVLAVAIAAVPFRRGERWAWWALLVGNLVTLGSAMTYDRLARAIGPFEVSEYIGLACLLAALALTAPLRSSRSAHQPASVREGNA
jgi:hypothetical protein